MGFFSSLRKSWRLRSISKAISRSGREQLSLGEVLYGNPDRQVAEEALFDLVQNDPVLSNVMTRHSAGRRDLEHAFHMLLTLGCGQWVRGHYVAVSALAFGFTLDYTLKVTKGKTSVNLEVLNRLIEYFETGEVGPVT
jgi:hypothetical protein